MKKISISFKLISTSTILSIIIIAGVASFTFFKAEKIILERSFKQVYSINNNQSNIIRSYLRNCSNKINLAKNSTDIINITKELNKLHSTNKYRFTSSEIKHKSLFANKLKTNYYTNIFIIGTNKNIYYLKKTGKEKKQSYYNSIDNIQFIYNRVYIQDFNNRNRNNIKLISQIKNERNEIIGKIIFEISSKKIDNIMLSSNKKSGFEDTGETYMVGKDYLMRSSSRFMKKSVMRTKVKTAASIESFKGNSSTKIIKDYRNKKVLSSYSIMNFRNIKWAVITEIDYNEITIPLRKIKKEIIGIGIFIFLIEIFVIIMLSKNITKPIERLNHAVKEISDGNYNINITNIPKDEIGELTNTFNKMVVQLKIKTKELEIERRKNLRSLLDGQESERQRISSELHDSLGQLLIALKLKYENTISKNNINNSDFNNLRDLFDKTIDETRRISNNLMPASLQEFGLISAIRHICNEISDSSNIELKLSTEGSAKNLNSETKTYIFRIVQEAITNIMKHSEAEKAFFDFKFTQEHIYISIKDNGKGFSLTNKTNNNSNGLTNIKNRVYLLSGTLNINTEINKGTEINIEIPINNMRWRR